MKKPAILTTVVGSYPVPAWLAAFPTQTSLRDAILEPILKDMAESGEMARIADSILKKETDPYTIAEDVARQADPSLAPLFEKMRKAGEPRRPQSDNRRDRKQPE